ncbi:hypothetical protein V1318_11505 [Lysobacter sp. CCNWLW3]|uniref:hypothetical protein n=1 Tax=unclassified Lysobacter TaxID=2635362 RepID=UPI002FCF65AA
MNDLVEHLLHEEIDGPDAAAVPAKPADPSASASTPAAAAADKALDPELAKVLERLMQPDVLRALTQLLRAR